MKHWILWLISFCLLVDCITLNLTVINQTSQPMMHKPCQEIGQSTNRSSFIDPFTENTFTVESVLIAEGQCYYAVGNVDMIVILWYWNRKLNREYYGITTSDTYKTFIRQAKNETQYIIIEK